MKAPKTRKSFSVRRSLGKALTSWGVGAFLFLGTPPAVSAQEIVRGEGDLVSVTANGVPLQTVLDGFAQLVQVKRSVKEGLGERMVAIDLEMMPIAMALRRVLQAADVDFVISGDAANPPIRVLVGYSSALETRTAVSGPADVIAEQGRELVSGAVTEQREEERPGQPEDVPGTQTESRPEPKSGTTTERLVQLLAPTLHPQPSIGAPIALPFPGPDGQPHTVPNYPPPPGIAQLPFPNPATGQPLEVTVPLARPGVAALPFPSPDGQRRTSPAAPAAGAIRRPGGD